MARDKQTFEVVVLAAIFVGFVNCLPLETTIPETQPTPGIIDSTTKTDDYYENKIDQRQNGTENYRIDVDGVVLVVAPMEALLLASGAAGNIEDNLSLISDGGISVKPEMSIPKPKPEKPILAEKPKGVQRSSLRFMNLLAPFIKRLRQQGIKSI